MSRNNSNTADRVEKVDGRQGEVSPNAFGFGVLGVLILTLLLALAMALPQVAFGRDAGKALDLSCLEELKIKEVEADRFAFKSLSGDLIEIGQERHLSSQPYLKLNKWDGEVSLKVDVPYGKNGVKSLTQNRLIWANHKYEVHFYPKEPEEVEENGYKRTINEDGGVEFDVVLKEKPESNVFEFPIETKGLKFYYQPELTQEYQSGWSEEFQGTITATETEVRGTSGDILVYRPENVVGSYAVYHAAKKDHVIGQTNYMTGKAFHIYRPFVTDAEGNKIWAEMKIADGKLTITIDQNWLDKAAYPVTIDPTFGQTATGGSVHELGTTDQKVGSHFTLTENGDVTQIAFYGVAKKTGMMGKALIYSDSSAPDALLGTSTAIEIGASAGWNTFTFSPPVSLSAGEYWLVRHCDDSIDRIDFNYDVGVANKGAYNTDEYADGPSNPFGTATYTNYEYSIYATYTVSVSVTFTNGANAALNYQQTSPSPPQDNWHFGQFSLAAGATGATLNSVAVMLGGSYGAGDLDSDPLPFHLYASTTSSFGDALPIGSDVADPGSGNDVTFSSLSDAIPSGTRYYWVTADISGTATGDDNINGTISDAGDLSITDGSLSGSSNYGKLNAGSDVTLPVELSSFTATAGNGKITLCWVTESEIENLGFNIYHSTKDNDQLSIMV